jgi:carbon-monoxide dehydrogenase medium subunit
MYPASFDYYRASSLDEAVKLLGEHDDAKVLAGGHSLIPMMKLHLAEPAAVIDIGRIADLKGVTKNGDSCRVGALSTHNEIAGSELQDCCGILAEAASKVGDPAVRNRGTIGGNIAHADPASDLPAALLAVGATIHLTGPGGARSVEVEDFFTGLLETDMKDGEILTHVEVPCLSGGFAYLKVEHPASGYAICGAAAVIEDGRATLAFNGIAAVPFVAHAVGDALAMCEHLSDAAIDKAVDEHLSVEDPLSDIQASGEYRVVLAKAYGKRALKAARDRA